MILFHWHVGDANKVYLILAANRLLRAYKLGFRYTLFLGRPQSLLPYLSVVSIHQNFCLLDFSLPKEKRKMRN